MSTFIPYLFLLKRVEVVENLFIIKGLILKKKPFKFTFQKLVESLSIAVDICSIHITTINNDLQTSCKKNINL